jgi:hypothetical protein
VVVVCEVDQENNDARHSRSTTTTTTTTTTTAQPRPQEPAALRRGARLRVPSERALGTAVTEAAMNNTEHSQDLRDATAASMQLEEKTAEHRRREGNAERQQRRRQQRTEEKAFPVLAADCLTGHKCQGQTMSSILVASWDAKQVRPCPIPPIAFS